MNIISVRDKALKRLIEHNDAKGIAPDLLSRVRAILTAIVSAVNMDGIPKMPGWRVHQLKGDRAGTWSLSVSGNWRITFDVINDQILNLDLEDYH